MIWLSWEKARSLEEDFVDMGKQAQELANRSDGLGLVELGGILWKVKFHIDFCILANLGCLAGLLGPSGSVCGRQLLAKPLLKARPAENRTPEIAVLGFLTTRLKT